MDEELAIKVEHVSKKYCKSIRRSMGYGIKDITRNIFGLSSHSEKLRRDEFWAVNDVSFEVKKGEILGIIGPNGSGKTTLLKLINGIFWPDKGKITVKGKVGALIEVGAGFHPMLTGRQNVYINGAILGMSKKEIDEKFDSIIKFADIGEFIDVPVKYYSSGMFVRLGFAVAVHRNPDILLVDEVLAVGDLEFHNKCMQKMGEITQNGTTVLLVSHDITTVQRICNKCLFLNNGKLVSNSYTNEVVNEYYIWVSNSTNKHKEELIPKNDVGAKLSELIICDTYGNEKDRFETGEKVSIKLKFLVAKPIINPILHISLNGDTYHGYNTRDDNIQIDIVDNNTEIILEVDFLGLSTGIYHICVALWDETYIYPYYWDWDVGQIEILSPIIPLGRFIFKHNWKILHKDEN